MTAEQRNDFRGITETVGRGTIGRTICRRSAVIATRSDTRHRGKNSPLLLAALLLCSGCDRKVEAQSDDRMHSVEWTSSSIADGPDCQKRDVEGTRCVVCANVGSSVAVSCDWRER